MYSLEVIDETKTNAVGQQQFELEPPPSETPAEVAVHANGTDMANATAIAEAHTTAAAAASSKKKSLLRSIKARLSRKGNRKDEESLLTEITTEQNIEFLRSCEDLTPNTKAPPQQQQPWDLPARTTMSLP